MKTILEYQCEICHRRYPTGDQALDCEAKGQADPDKLETGVIIQIGDNDPKDMYSNMTFCVVSWSKSSYHFCTPSLWACRDTPTGDSLDTDLCGGGELVSLKNPFYNEYRSVKNMTSPHFRRMVKYLHDHNMPVKYLYDSQIITMTQEQINEIINIKIYTGTITFQKSDNKPITQKIDRCILNNHELSFDYTWQFKYHYHCQLTQQPDQSFIGLYHVNYGHGPVSGQIICTLTNNIITGSWFEENNLWSFTLTLNENH